MKNKKIFTPKTERIGKMAEVFPKRIKELSEIFNAKTNVYIDYANVFFWAKKLNWHVDLRRLKQLFDSFKTIDKVRFYNGTLTGDKKSERLIKEVTKLHYDVHTKPVKIMHLPIDVSSIPLNSPAILERFIKRPLLKYLSIETIEYLNERIGELNKRGIKFIEHRKCNFDVEMGRDMLIDYERNSIKNFVLWTGDSDFADPINQLLKDGKRVVIFATVRRIAVELAKTKAQIFDIQKIRNFICWPRELNQKG